MSVVLASICVVVLYLALAFIWGAVREIIRLSKVGAAYEARLAALRIKPEPRPESP